MFTRYLIVHGLMALFFGLSNQESAIAAELEWKAVSSGGGQDASDGNRYLSGTLGLIVGEEAQAVRPGIFLFPGYWVPFAVPTAVEANSFMPAGYSLQARMEGPDLVIRYQLPGAVGDLQLLDMRGQVLYQRPVNRLDPQLRLPATLLQDGIYFARLITDQGQLVARFVEWRR